MLRVGYDGSQYDRPELKWTQRSYIQPQMMIEDRYFYDPVAQKYTVDRYLDDLEKRYGGIDAVLIWHVYPNIGIDNRNQYDMLRAMPGGVAGVKKMVADFHRRGVRVFFPVIMWDQGTRDEGKSNWLATAQWMAEVGADGINGDTLEGVPRAFRTSSDEVGHPLALEPESAPLSDEGLMWNNLTWSDIESSFTPYVSHMKWLETRHMVNISDRWNRDKTDDLQYAWFNGVGYESWENIWSIWNGITPRDAEALRRVATMERALARFLVSKDWEPLTPTLRYGVFASKWPLGAETVWTLANRNDADSDGRQLELPYQAGMHYYDLYHGVELQPDRDGSKIVLSFNIEGHGYGAVLATGSAPDAGEQALMTKMKQLAAQPLASYSHEWHFLPQKIVPIAPAVATASNPEGMVKIPAANYVFRVHGIELEGG
ncbi:MAG: formylglycine-generating enzyme family protein, partial [Candidatus Sulfotelmatobacter sp.]